MMKKNKNLLGLAFGIAVFLLALPLIISQLTFERNQDINLALPCSFNGTFCSDTATCVISLQYPNGSLQLDNLTMSNTGNGMPNIDVNDSTILGEHTIFYSCTQNSVSDSATLPMFITETGHNQNTSQAIGSLGFLLMMIAITAGIGFLGFKLSETENLWPIGIFFLLIMIFFLVFDIYLGYEYRLNFTGADNDSGVIETLFYIFLFLFTTGVAVTIAMLFRKWHRIVDWFKSAFKKEESDDDFFSGKDGFKQPQ